MTHRPTPTVRHAGALQWEPTASPGVWRKPLERRGALGANQTTSLVRYDPGVVFPEHDHPDGEEILVLEGCLRDERGEFGPGAYLVNVQGFRHTPRSETGCTMFVKLRQLPGTGRTACAVDTSSRSFASAGIDGVSRLALHELPEHPERMWLTRIAPGTVAPRMPLVCGEELFVVDGAFEDEFGRYPTHTWLRFPPMSAHAPRSDVGCLLYVCQHVEW